MKGFLHPKIYANIVNLTTLTSVDIIIIYRGTHVLVGERKNNPAKGSLFLPGARFGKYVTIKEAVSQTVSDEIGLKIPFHKFKRLLPCEHIYHTNFTAGENSTLPFGTHYVVQPFVYDVERLDQDELEILARHMSKQHNYYCWMPISKLVQDKNVHPYTKRYWSSGKLEGGW